uniref:Uncharacterized protein n=2 Tax=Anser TaxID=8842 RepID=A0A8B9I236_9AVES
LSPTQPRACGRRGTGSASGTTRTRPRRGQEEEARRPGRAPRHRPALPSPRGGGAPSYTAPPSAPLSVAKWRAGGTRLTRSPDIGSWVGCSGFTREL